MKELGAFASGGNYKVEDLHLKNVIAGIDGNLYVIDAITTEKHAEGKGGRTNGEAPVENLHTLESLTEKLIQTGKTYEEREQEVWDQYIALRREFDNSQFGNSQEGEKRRAKLLQQTDAVKKELYALHTHKDALQELTQSEKKIVEERKTEQGKTNFVKNDSNEIPEPISSGERGTENPEDQRLEEVSRRLKEGIGQSEGTGKADQKDAEARIALQYAKENNLWIPDIYSLGESFASGNESTVVVDASGGVVYKSNNLMNSITISNLLDQIKLHNQLFPSTRYDLVGFTGIDNGGTRPPYIEVVLRQSLINESVPANDIEINQYMKSLGFDRSGDGVFSNGDIILRDIHPRNVLKDSGGDIYVIDNIIRPDEVNHNKKTTYGKSNTVFTEDAAQKARELLRKKLGGQLSAGIDPEVFMATVQLAGYHIEAGARKFAAFSKAMTEDIGEAIKPYLKGAYENIRRYPGMENIAKEMDDTNFVDNYNFDEQHTVTGTNENNQSDEGNRNTLRTDGTSGDGRISTGTTSENGQGGTEGTSEADRTQSRNGDRLETDSDGQGGNGRRDDGSHVRPSESELHAGGTGGNRHQRRASTADTAAADQTGQKRNSQESLVR